MAKADYSQSIEDVSLRDAPPTSVPGGAVQDAAAAGNAQVNVAKAKAGLVEFLGTMFETGVKAKMKSDEEGDINSILQKLDSVADKDIDTNNQKIAGGLLDSMGSDDYMGQQTIASFTDEARRYAEARRQGVIGRDEALAQIGAVVKKYSAMAPGWASDFRKMGAKLTGIDNVDVYGIHQALTTASMKEKLTLKAAEEDMQLRKEAATALGLSSLNELTPDSLSFYRSVKQAQLAVGKMTAIKQAGDMEQEQRDKVGQQLASTYIGMAVSGVVSRFAQLHASHMTADSPDKQAAATKLGGEVAAELDVTEAALISKLKGLAIGQNAMDSDKNRKMVDEVQGIFKTYKEVVKTSEGYNLWNNIIKASKGNAEYVVNSFKVAHPHAAVLAEFGVMSKFAEAMVALGGDEKAFRARFGSAATDAALSVLNNGNKPYANAIGAVAAGSAGIDDVSKVDPQMGRVAYNDVVQIIDDQARNGGVLRNEQKQSLSNLVHQWTYKMNPTDPANLKKFVEIAGDPNGKFWTQMTQLDSEQRKHAFLPFFDKVVNTTPNMMKDLKGQVEQYNNLEVNKESGNKVAIKYDPLTYRFSVDVQRGNLTPAPQRIGSFGVGADQARNRQLLNEGFDRLATAGDPSQRELLAVMQQRVQWLNAVPDVMAKALPLANDSFTGIKAAELGAELNNSFKSGEGGLGKALVNRMNKTLVPGNTKPVSPDIVALDAKTGANIPSSQQELMDQHKTNIVQIEQQLKVVTHPKARAILEEELASEKQLLVGASK